MKVSAYHSSNPADPDVHHDHDDCPTGQQIPARNKVAGAGSFPGASSAATRVDLTYAQAHGIDGWQGQF